jgi:alanyl-tRNA synthetase
MSGLSLPQTVRLHLEDTYRLEFEGLVQAVRPAEQGGIEVALDATAFYVGSGGQPSDGGTLAGREVRSVHLEDGVVWHRLEVRPGDAMAECLPGGFVEGRIDAALRLDHMQQHTGQHILSQAFVRCAQLPTVGFHLGREESTVDLRGERPEPDAIERVLLEANDCVLADRPVRVHFVERTDLERYPLRRDAAAEHDVFRLIEIEEYDWSACGGTHARRTGEVGPIQILGVERIRQDWRIRFLAGRRALAYLRAAHRLLDETARAHSLHWTAIPEAAAGWKKAAADAEREVRRLQVERGEREGARLARETPADARGRRVRGCWAGEAGAEELRALATSFGAAGGALFLGGSRTGDRCAWVAACGERADATSGLPPADALLQDWLAEVAGKGGGNAAFARGTSPAPPWPAEELERRLRAWLQKRIEKG